MKKTAKLLLALLLTGIPVKAQTFVPIVSGAATVDASSIATGTKMPFHVWAKVEGASASGTVLSLQLVAPTVGDLVTIYRGAACTIY